MNRFIENLSLNEFPHELTISYGISNLDYKNFIEIIKTTDLKMFDMKKNKN